MMVKVDAGANNQDSVAADRIFVTSFAPRISFEDFC